MIFDQLVERAKSEKTDGVEDGKKRYKRASKLKNSGKTTPLLESEAKEDKDLDDEDVVLEDGQVEPQHSDSDEENKENDEEKYFCPKVLLNIAYGPY